MSQTKLFLKDEIKGDIGNDPADVLTAALEQGIISEEDFKKSIRTFPTAYQEHIFTELNKHGVSISM